MVRFCYELPRVHSHKQLPLCPHPNWLNTKRPLELYNLLGGYLLLDTSPEEKKKKGSCPAWIVRSFGSGRGLTSIRRVLEQEEKDTVKGCLVAESTCRRETCKEILGAQEEQELPFSGGSARKTQGCLWKHTLEFFLFFLS